MSDGLIDLDSQSLDTKLFASNKKEPNLSIFTNQDDQFVNRSQARKLSKSQKLTTNSSREEQAFKEKLQKAVEAQREEIAIIFEGKMKDKMDVSIIKPQENLFQ